ncbi:DNA-directed RNA polymerase III, subunit Rpc31 [Scleroderma citrinum]
MSRGSRGGRGGRGGFRGSGSGFGAGALPPMGLTFTDIQAMSREADSLYPPIDPLPVLLDYSEEEKRICQLQNDFTVRLRKSPYYVVESIKSNELERYSDKYRRSPASQPTLKRSDLHAPFFPQEIFHSYFNPKKKRKIQNKAKSTHLNLDNLVDDVDEQEKSGDEGSNAGSQQVDSDYDVDEEYDNDYADNYFDNGEGDDLDDMVGGGGGEDGGGGGRI